MTDVITIINTFAWVGGNVLVAYIAVALVVFVVAYRLLFDPGATTAGKFIFRFMLSLVGVVGLVFIGLFIDPSSGREWFTYPGDVAIWRPAVRFAIWGYVAWTITALAVLLALRKWKPHLLQSAPDRDLVKVRNPKENIVTHVDPTVPTIWFKTQRVLRTIVQALVVLVPLVNAVAAVTFGYLNEQTDVVVPGWAFVILNAVIAATAVIMGLIARIMAIPGVNDWLTKIGLGSVPKSAIKQLPPA